MLDEQENPVDHLTLVDTVAVIRTKIMAREYQEISAAVVVVEVFDHSH